MTAAAVLTAFAFAGPALAAQATGDGGTVAVNINVLPTVSMWSNDATINLNLSGQGQENWILAASSLDVINNVDAHVSANVDGTLPDDMVDSQNNTVPALNFFIFGSGDAAAAHAAIVANSNAPSGALVWNKDNLNTSKTVIDDTGINSSIKKFDILYGADAPNVLPSVANWALTVTYTITSNT